MSTATVPLASLSATYHPPRPDGAPPRTGLSRRALVWLVGLVFAVSLYIGITAFWNWKHFVASSGGRYFVHRIEIPVPFYSQGDPRWNLQLLGPTMDTVGQAGCALTSAAMVLSSYGVDTDPQRLNQYLNATGGYTPQGWIYWEKAADLAGGQVEKVYEDLPTYALIDQNLLEGNPVIVRLTLHNGMSHFVVIVGKDGWDYLIQDPARTPDWGVYPLKDLVSHIEGLRFYHRLPASASVANQAVTPPPS